MVGIPQNQDTLQMMNSISQDVLEELGRVLKSNQVIGVQVEIPTQILSQNGQYEVAETGWRVEQISNDLFELVDQNNNERIQISHKNLKLCNYKWVIHVVEDFFGL
eukprot:TRINITY_DN9878_c1_g3_i4.p5 TRINITY_DN9878_c1_g3~~TRINITY_DN9878_c1_g3_i4.p5  ORF type:complete len:106 (-),score=11.57 TRINITY_DN9878_c1_g3_i4:260-577(-)